MCEHVCVSVCACVCVSMYICVCVCMCMCECLHLCVYGTFQSCTILQYIIFIVCYV